MTKNTDTKDKSLIIILIQVDVNTKEPDQELILLTEAS